MLSREPGTSRSTHTCPGGCGRQVRADLFACKRDWFRLPSVLRAAIWTAYRAGDGAAHAEALAEALRWFGENEPRPPDPMLF